MLTADHKNKLLRVNGFTLIEVLVAVLLLSVGVLGVIALESHIMRQNQTAYYRSQATILIYDLADKMRANRGADYADEAPNASASANDCVFYSESDSLTNCSNPSEIARKQLYDWKQNISKLLPVGSGAISSSSSIYSIQVSWDEDRDGVADTSDKDEFLTMSFEL